MSRILNYRLLFLVLLLSYSSTYAETDHSEYLSVEERENKYLYVGDIDQLKHVNSMVYLLADNTPENKHLIDIITFISNELGEENGIVHLPPGEDKDKKNSSLNIQFLLSRTCDKNFIFKENSIIFENRLTKKCTLIPISESAPALNTFQVIIENINNNENIFMYSKRLEIYKAIEENIKSLDIPEENIPLVEDIFMHFKASYEEYFKNN